MIKIIKDMRKLGKIIFFSCFTLSFNFGATCDESSGWCYDLSVNQCFYNFEQAQLSIDGQVQSLDSGSFDGNSCPNADCDIIGVFVILDNGQEQCIGWQYQLPDVIGTYQVPAMGYYEVEGDVIYGLENGQIPMFKIWDASEEIAYDAIVLNKEQILDSNDDGFIDCADLSDPPQDDEYIDENGNGQWDPSIIPGFQNNSIHSIKEIKGTSESTDCNGDEIPASEEICDNDSMTLGCAVYDECNTCVLGLTCIDTESFYNEVDGFIEEDDFGGSYDCAGECYGQSYFGVCGACLSSDKEPDYYLDCANECHPNETPIGCSGDEDCGIKRFDDLYLEYEIESNGCCNPDDWSLWYDDADMDMLGDPELAYNLCLPDFISRPISQNNYDLYPSCFSNSVDDCGVCDGFNLDMDCLGDCPSYTPNACTENYFYYIWDGGPSFENQQEFECGTASIDLCGECNHVDVMYQWDGSDYIEFDEENISCTGCTDSDAANHNPDALFYDGSCYFEVWPGDTDVNGIVGGSDVIPIGIFWGEMGSNRSIESGNDYTWQSQYGYDNWNNKMALYADANGDGLIDIFDILVVLINWGNVVESDSYNTVVNSYYDDIDLDLYRSNFEEIYNSLPTGYDNNPIQLFLEEMFGFESIVQLPQEYKLHQNRPNPFNPATNIVYEIPNQGEINIIITNILGEVVEEYKGYIESPGVYSYTFDASMLPSGIYLYHLKTKSGINLTNKMMLIK